MKDSPKKKSRKSLDTSELSELTQIDSDVTLSVELNGQECQWVTIKPIYPTVLIKYRIFDLQYKKEEEAHKGRTHSGWKVIRI